MGGVFLGVDAELVALAVAFEAEDDRAVGGGVEGAEIVLHGGESAIVLEGDLAGEDGVAGLVEGEASQGAPAHDGVVFDFPAAEVRALAELKEGLVAGGVGGLGRRGVAVGATGGGQGQGQDQEGFFHR